MIPEEARKKVKAAVKEFGYGSPEYDAALLEHAKAVIEYIEKDREFLRECNRT